MVVLNYNGGDTCCSAWRRSSAPTGRATASSIVVVDNASVDGSVDDIERRFEQVRVIRNPTNTGFPANNVATATISRLSTTWPSSTTTRSSSPGGSPLVDALETDPGLGAGAGDPVRAALRRGPIEAPHVPGRRVMAAISASGSSGLEVDGMDVLGVAQLLEGSGGSSMAAAAEPQFAWTAGRAGFAADPRGARRTGRVRIPSRCRGREGADRASDDAACPARPVTPRTGCADGSRPSFDVINNVGSIS